MRVMVTLLLASLVLASVSAQLNFSPGWGKRASTAAGEGAGLVGGGGGGVGGLHPAPPAPQQDSGCGTIPVSTIMHLYKIIKAEAARLVQCQEEEYLG